MNVDVLELRVGDYIKHRVPNTPLRTYECAAVRRIVRDGDRTHVVLQKPGLQDDRTPYTMLGCRITHVKRHREWWAVIGD